MLDEEISDPAERAVQEMLDLMNVEDEDCIPMRNIFIKPTMFTSIDLSV